MGGTSQSRLALPEDATEQERLKNLKHQVITNELLLSRILEYVIRKYPRNAITYSNPAPSYLVAKQAAPLRLVCRQWNQEICSLFLRHRQPLLYLVWNPTRTRYFGIQQPDWLGYFLSNYQGQLPAFRLTLDEKVLIWVPNFLQFREILDTIFIKCGGAGTLVQLLLEEDLYRPPLNGTLQELLPETLPAELEFTALDKVICRFFPLKQDHIQARVTTFLQEVLNRTPNLKEFSLRAFSWPAFPQLRYPATLTLLNVVDVMLPTANNAPMTKLAHLCVDGMISEEDLLRLLAQCQHSLEVLIVCNVFRFSIMNLNLARFPVMSKVTKLNTMGYVQMENPLEIGARRQVVEKFPALKHFKRDVFVDGVANPAAEEELMNEGAVPEDQDDERLLRFQLIERILKITIFLCFIPMVYMLCEPYVSENPIYYKNGFRNEEGVIYEYVQNLVKSLALEAQRIWKWLPIS